MTRPCVLLLLPAFVAGLVVGVAIPVLGGSAGSQVTNLLTVALAAEFTPNREVLIDLVEIPPNQKLDWHWHPGEEFHYYLEGNPVIERVDASPIIGKPGTVGHVAFEQRHQATAGDQGAKILVFRVHTKGAPWRYPGEMQGHWRRRSRPAQLRVVGPDRKERRMVPKAVVLEMPSREGANGGSTMP